MNSCECSSSSSSSPPLPSPSFRSQPVCSFHHYFIRYFLCCSDNKAYQWYSSFDLFNHSVHKKKTPNQQTHAVFPLSLLVLVDRLECNQRLQVAKQSAQLKINSILALFHWPSSKKGVASMFFDDEDDGEQSSFLSSSLFCFIEGNRLLTLDWIESIQGIIKGKACHSCVLIIGTEDPIGTWLPRSINSSEPNGNPSLVRSSKGIRSSQALSLNQLGIRIRSLCGWRSSFQTGKSTRHSSRGYINYPSYMQTSISRAEKPDEREKKTCHVLS